MPIPRNIQEELEKRDELILALELLVVDQACRLLAAEAVLRELIPPQRKPSQEKIEAHIAEASERFRQRFEGESVAGFTGPGEAHRGRSGRPLAHTRYRIPASGMQVAIAVATVSGNGTKLRRPDRRNRTPRPARRVSQPRVETASHAVRAADVPSSATRFAGETVVHAATVSHATTTRVALQAVLRPQEQPADLRVFEQSVAGAGHGEAA